MSPFFGRRSKLKRAVESATGVPAAKPAAGEPGSNGAPLTGALSPAFTAESPPRGVAGRSSPQPPITTAPARRSVQAPLIGAMLILCEIRPVETLGRRW